MNEADDISRRAHEIKARAERIAEDAIDSDALRDELDRLDAELAQLDDEQRRLDEELRDRADASASGSAQSSSRPAWAETVSSLVSDVTERITAVGSGRWPWQSSKTIERSVTTDKLMPVVIENRAGSVKVLTGTVNVVTVSADLFAPSAHLLDDMAVTAELEGPEVLIRCHWPENHRGRHARLRVTVPPGTSVRANTSGGSVAVKDTHGSATIATGGGSIKISGTNGDVDARTAGGSIRVDDHAGPVHASTNGGSVHLAGVLIGTVEANTAGGSIHIDGADHATVTAATSGGSIRLRGRLAGHSRLRTAGGSVSVSIPSDNQLHVDAKGTSASCDFVELDTKRGRIHGTLGDGSDGTVELRTIGGSVTLGKT
jgi:hypothetical protein